MPPNMQSLIVEADAANRPIFRFERHDELTANPIPSGQLALTGPSEKLDAAHWPVRGDLAHINLAGRCFVPHYAVPMPRVIAAGGSPLRSVGNAEAPVMEELAGGTLFNALDMAGGWAWGQVGEDGLVGYVPLTALEA